MGRHVMEMQLPGKGDNQRRGIWFGCGEGGHARDRTERILIVCSNCMYNQLWRPLIGKSKEQEEEKVILVTTWSFSLQTKRRLNADRFSTRIAVNCQLEYFMLLRNETRKAFSANIREDRCPLRSCLHRYVQRYRVYTFISVLVVYSRSGKASQNADSRQLKMHRAMYDASFLNHSRNLLRAEWHINTGDGSIE